MTHDFGMKAAARLAIVLLALGGCASRYAYDFHLAGAGVLPVRTIWGAERIADRDLSAEILVDVAAGAILLELTNETDQVLQVEWAATTLTCCDGSVMSLRPDVDLGWMQPHATVGARLTPIALPRSGSKAAAYAGQSFHLDLPAVVRRERRVYRYALIANVHEL